MSVFRDPAQAAAFLGGFFREESTKKSPFVEGSGIIVGYTLRNPDVKIVMDATVKPEPGRAFAIYVDDPRAPKPTVELLLESETFHKLYSGEVQALSLIASGQLQANGDLNVALRLLPSLAARIPYYKSYCTAHPLN